MHLLESIDQPTIRELLARDEFFWLDLTSPSERDIALLGELFHLHPLAVEDTTKFGQRPKLDDYEDYMMLVYYGARNDHHGEVALVEVHAFLSGSYIITVHRDPCEELVALRERLRRQEDRSEQFVIYRVLDALTDSFFPVLEKVDDEIDGLEDEIIERPTDAHLQRISALKRELIALRRVVTPQRDLLARNIDDILELPGLERDTRNYFRDVYDHVIRISDLIDSYRDLLSGTRDTYLSVVSNRLNAISKQLTVVATIFLPLAFITGFFGQNFKWMTDHVESFASFAIFGVGGLIVAGVAMLVWFKRNDYV